MKKYSRHLIENINQSNEINISGMKSELVSRFYTSVRSHESTNQRPIVIQCFGITNPNPNYCVKRKKSHNYVLEYVREGKGYIEINDSKFTVTAGDAYLLCPKTKQNYYSDKDHPLQKYWVNFVGTDIDNVLELLHIKGIHHFPNCNLMGHFIQLFSLDEMDMASIDFTFFAYSTIVSMLIEMKKSLIKNGKEESVANRIKEMIDSHISENIKILDICNKLKLSKSSVINIFKNAFHITPNQYKMQRKMEIARNMLLNKDISIKQIAISLGFIDQYHFSNSFKNHHRMYPSEYRKLHFKIK